MHLSLKLLSSESTSVQLKKLVNLRYSKCSININAFTVHLYVIGAQSLPRSTLELIRFGQASQEHRCTRQVKSETGLGPIEEYIQEQTNTSAAIWRGGPETSGFNRKHHR